MAVKSELQKSADRVRAIKQAVDQTKCDLAVCVDEYNAANMVFEEAKRNLEDTRDLLNARRFKLDRELQSVCGIVESYVETSCFKMPDPNVF